MIKVLQNIAKMDKYSPPWVKLDRSKYIRLDMNENTQPPPPEVYASIIELLQQDCLQMYPNYEHFLPKLAKYVGVDKEQILLTNGSDQAIEIILRSFLSVNDEIVIAEPGFPIFSQVANVIGARISKVALNDDMSFPIDNFLSVIKPTTSLVVVINPNNPTGTMVSLEQIEEILIKAKNIPVVVDEAYFEFTNITTLNFIEKYPNLIIVRTFSKVFAMASLRLGYIIANKIVIDEFYKVRGPFDINICALAAAGAQIDNSSTWRKYVSEVMLEAKPLLEEFLRLNNISFFKGAANFILIRPPNKDNFVDFLSSNNILVRPMTSPSILDTVRVSIGNVEETKILINIFTLYLKKESLP